MAPTNRLKGWLRSNKMNHSLLFDQARAIKTKASNTLENESKKIKCDVSQNIHRLDFLNYKIKSGVASPKFAVLARTVKHLKELYLDGHFEKTVYLDDILEQIEEYNVSPKTLSWLTLQALPNNSKVEVTNDGRYKFKPPYQIFDKAGLLKLLRKYLRKGLGVILLDDVKESLPDCSKAIKRLSDQLVCTIGVDGKEGLSLRDKDVECRVDDLFHMSWRGVQPLPDDSVIEQYLENRGLGSTKTPSGVLRRACRSKTSSKVKKEKKQVPVQWINNQHVASMLNMY